MYPPQLSSCSASAHRAADRRSSPRSVAAGMLALLWLTLRLLEHPRRSLLRGGASLGAGHQRRAPRERLDSARVRAGSASGGIANAVGRAGRRARPVRLGEARSSGRCSCGCSRRGDPRRSPLAVVDRRCRDARVRGRRSASTGSDGYPDLLRRLVRHPVSRTATRSWAWLRLLGLPRRRWGEGSRSSLGGAAARRLRRARATRRRASLVHLRGGCDARPEPDRLAALPRRAARAALRSARPRFSVIWLLPGPALGQPEAAATPEGLRPSRRRSWQRFWSSSSCVRDRRRRSQASLSLRSDPGRVVRGSRGRGDSITLARVAPGSIVLCGAVFRRSSWPCSSPLRSTTTRSAEDFQQFYRAAVAILHGRTPYRQLGTVPQAVWGGPYPYPPLAGAGHDSAHCALPQRSRTGHDGASRRGGSRDPVRARGARLALLRRRPSLAATSSPPIQTGNITLRWGSARRSRGGTETGSCRLPQLVGSRSPRSSFLWPLVVWLAATNGRRAPSPHLPMGVGLPRHVVGASSVSTASWDYPDRLRRLDQTLGEDSYTTYIVGLDAGLPSAGCTAALAGLGRRRTGGSRRYRATRVTSARRSSSRCALPSR